MTYNKIYERIDLGTILKAKNLNTKYLLHKLFHFTISRSFFSKYYINYTDHCHENHDIVIKNNKIFYPFSCTTPCMRHFIGSNSLLLTNVRHMYYYPSYRWKNHISEKFDELLKDLNIPLLSSGTPQKLMLCQSLCFLIFTEKGCVMIVHIIIWGQM